MIARNDHDGKYPAFAWPGGYPITYLLADGGVLCPACANGDNGSEATEDPGADKEWRLAASDVHWEGPASTCECCGAELESAYGDPDAEASTTETE